MDRGRSLLIFKVKGHISRSLGLYEEFWHLDPCVQDIARTIWSRVLKLVCILYMDRGRSLFFKVKGQISRSLGLYKEFLHLDPCWQDIARTIWHRMLKLSVYTLYGQKKKPIYFQGQRSNFKVTGPTIWPRVLKLSVYTLYGQRKKPIFFKVKCQISRSLGLYKEFWHLDPCGQDIARTIQPRLLKLSMYT